MNVPILQVMVRKDQFSTVQKIIPAHEFPIWISGWGNENLEIIGKTNERHEIDDFDAEINRLEQSHGTDKLKKVFGESYIDGIEVSIFRKNCKIFENCKVIYSTSNFGNEIKLAIIKRAVEIE